MLTSQKALRLVLLLSCLALMAMLGARIAFEQQQSLLDVFVGQVIALLVTMTCVTDARARGRPKLEAARLAMLIACPVVVPVYLLWSRGWWGMAVLLILLVSLIGVALAGAAAGAIAGLLIK